MKMHGAQNLKTFGDIARTLLQTAWREKARRIRENAPGSLDLRRGSDIKTPIRIPDQESPSGFSGSYGSNFIMPRGTGAVVGAHLTVRDEFDGSGLMYRLPALRLRPAVGACSRQGTSFSAAVEMNCGLGLIPAQPGVSAQTAKEMHARIPIASRHMVAVARSAFECVSIHAAANSSLSVTGIARQMEKSARDTGGDSIARERFNGGEAVLCEPLDLE